MVVLTGGFLNEKGELKNTLLLRPNTRKKNYQELSNSLSAIEPPLFMALRATELLLSNQKICIIDAEVQEFNIDKIVSDNVEIFPIGSHPSAYIHQREGIKKLACDLAGKGKKVEVWYKLSEFDIINAPLWDYFPMDKYRAHNWHCWGGYERRPYGVVCSSYGCSFSCDFCGINDFYGKYRERNLDLVLLDIERLVKKHGITNIKFLDEIFFLNSDRVAKLCDMIIACSFELNIWAYARLDTVKPELLPKLKKAGFRWLGIGIESGDEEIRKKSLKGKFNNEQIKEIIKIVKDNGIYIGANYIFGFFDDNNNTMRKTLDFAKELNCEFVNFNPMMAFPGTRIRKLAEELKWDLPGTWAGYSYYSYECHPIRTRNLSSAQVLKFRDDAFYDYYSDENYLSMMRRVFGADVVTEIKEMTKVKLKRKLLE